ncbi:restriction endonuclease subunit S, partial [Streptomyces sp. PRKS01-29]|nr:restriction endonuclease subunit S [Streptomyces sabulosicollis]
MTVLTGVPLPEGWSWAQLGDVCDTALGKMLDKAKATGKHPVPYLRNINVQWGRIDLSDVLTMDIAPDEQEFFSLQPNDLLVCEGGEIGRCAIWQGSVAYMAFQKALHRVRPGVAVSVRYLRYYLEHLASTGRLGKFATGSTIRHLPQQRLREVPIALPPVAEQHRIVEALEDHLSRLDAAEQSITQALSRARRLTSALSNITYGYRASSSEGSAAFPPPTGTDDRSLPLIPATWSWKRLETIADVVGGVAKDKKKQSDPNLPEVPYLRVANVQRGWLDLTQVASIRVPEKKALQLTLQKGDVLLNEGGDRDKLGRGWIWEDQIPGAIHQNHVFRARVHNGTIHPKLLSWYANSAARWFEVNGKQSVNLASISLSKIKQLPVPVPPQHEQDAIIERIEDQLSVLDNATSLAAQALWKASALRRAILNRAFTGLLVPQDPADEPASVLLSLIHI